MTSTDHAPALDDSAETTTRSARQWFIHAILKRRRVFMEAVIATFVISMLGLGASFYSLQVYDRVIPTQAHATLMALTVGVGIAVLFEFILKQVRSLMVDRGCKAIEEVLSEVFFQRMLDIRMEARPRTVGSFAAQVRQFELVRSFMSSSTVFLLADLPFCFLFIAVIGFIGGSLAVIPLVLLPLVLTSSIWLNWRIGRLTRRQLQDTRLKNGLLVDVIDGIESIKASGAETKMLHRWRQLVASSSSLELDTRYLSTMASHLAQLLQQLSYVAIIGLGAWMVSAGEISMGALIACSILSNRALSPITHIASWVTQWQHAKEALRGLDDMMRLPIDQPSIGSAIMPSACSGELRLEQATFAFSDKLTALQPTTMTISGGERVAIVGPIGSGKSTLIRLLSGLYRPLSGKIFLDGVDMALLARDFLREQIGYLPQDVRLVHGTLRDNLTLGITPPNDSALLEAAKMTGLDRVIGTHPQGMELPIQEGGRGLSGGQRQLLGLTRLLLRQPAVLLLDEPTAAMDAELEASVMQSLLAALPTSTTVVLVTHKANLLRLVDRVIVMDQGRILLDGPRSEVLTKLTTPVRTATTAETLHEALTNHGNSLTRTSS
jgi:ATP-binding cassette, subfamily C, bacterial LapB